jgi:type IV pilus assembly protein PilC
MPPSTTAARPAEKAAQTAAVQQALRKLKRPHVKTKDIAVMTRQMATMVGAGIPLVEGIDILAEQAQDVGFRQALRFIVDRIRAGSDFSSALAEHPRLFTNIYVNMVRAGEASGQLDVILNRLAGFLESNEELKREVKSAMMYPVISLLLILSITVGLIVGIIPKFKEIFKGLGMQDKDLPLPTLILLNISDVLRNNLLYVVIAAIVLYIGFKLFLKTRFGLRTYHRTLLWMPVFGPLIRKVVISRFTRTFATLIQSGVPIVGALEIVAKTAGNVVVEEAVTKARDSVSKGEPLAEPLEATAVFPPMVTRMISIGERTGALEQLLSKISDFYDNEVRTAVKALTSLIEPLLISVMGVIVGGIVLAIFMPIIKLQTMMTGGK